MTQNFGGVLRLQDYRDTGLYLTLENGTQLVLTDAKIQSTTAEYWADPDKIPANAKEAAAFQRCSFCPLKGEDALCDAIRPVFPLLDVVDAYVSFDRVLAAYKADDGSLTVGETSMQEALRHVSTLSLIHYCQVGRQYRKYYSGVSPLSGAEEFATRLYLNIFWAHSGDRDQTEEFITRFNDQIAQTSANQTARLRLICQNDAFMNAFVSAQAIISFLKLAKDSEMSKAFATP